jgi:hypothetical protein
MHWAVWLVPAALLLLALLSFPYGYYTFLRLAVTLSAGLLAYWSWSRQQPLWAIAFAAVALLFNPLFPVYLDRSTWGPIDVAVAALYIAHWLFTRGSRSGDHL